MKLKFVVFFHAAVFSVSVLMAQLQIAVDVEGENLPVAEEGSVVDRPNSNSHGKGSGPAIDILQFLSGDRLSGDLVSITADELKWTHPDASAAISLKTGNLQDLALKGNRNADAFLKLSRIEMTNGDVYRGEFVSMNATDFVLKTPYAGAITLSVPLIRSIHPATVSALIYEGPNSIDEWRSNSSKNWSFKNGSLINTSGGNSIGKPLYKLTDMASIDMDVAWRGNIQFNTGFWGENPESMNQNSYSLMIQGSYIRLYRYSNTRGGEDLGAFNLEQIQGKNRMRLSLKLNRKEKNIAMLIDGELVKQWKDSTPGAPAGSALIFQSNSGSGLRLSNIRVSQWDGKFGDKSGGGGDETDTVEFSNGDKFSGKLESIETGKMKFVTDFATFDVPVTRVARVDFAGKTREQARRNPGDVEVYFPSEERITLRIGSLSSEAFQGTSQNAGDVRVRRDMISKLRFNLYDPRQQKTEEEW